MSANFMATMSSKQPIHTEMKTKIGELIDVANNTGQKVSTWETIQELLKKAGLAWHGKCPPEFVANHGENRRPDMDACIHSVEDILKIACLMYAILLAFLFAGAPWGFKAWRSTTMDKKCFKQASACNGARM